MTDPGPVAGARSKRKRRLVAVAGGTCLAVGVAGVLVLQDVLSPGPGPRVTVTAMVLLALIPVGFVTMLEALVTWPDDGSPYPLRRRATSVAAGLGTALAATSVGLLVLVLLRQALLWTLPRDGRAAAVGGAIIAGMQVARAVWLRLRTGCWSPPRKKRRPDGRKGVAA